MYALVRDSQYADDMPFRAFVGPGVLAFSLVVSVSTTAHADARSAQLRLAGFHEDAHGRWLHDLCDHTRSHFCLAEQLLPPEWFPGMRLPQAQQGSAVGMAPADVIAAYGLASAPDATGTIVAILDSPDSNAYSDLSAYRSNYGIPALPQCTSTNPIGPSPCFAQVSENGGASTGQDSGQNGDGETGLDMDMISAACPACTILLVEIGDPTNGPSTQDFLTGAQTAASLGAVATSISFGGPESSDPANGGGGGTDPTGFTTAGHLVLAASGDFAYDNINAQGGPYSSPSWPSSAPDVVAVGGTDLYDLGSSYGEAVWNDGTFGATANGQDVTTSGCSTEYAMPSWQATPLTGSGCSQRATADVSAAATFTAGGQEEAIASFSSGQWEQVEGTSAASPLVAAIFARTSVASAISNNLGWPYSNTTAFNDVGSTGYPVPQGGATSDSNTTGCGILCTIGSGWDGPSGVGSPNGAELVSASGVTTGPESSSGSGKDAGASGGSGQGSGSVAGSGSTSGGSSGAGAGGSTTGGSGASGAGGSSSATGSGSNDDGNGSSAATGSSNGTGATRPQLDLGNSASCSAGGPKPGGSYGWAVVAFGMVAVAAARGRRRKLPQGSRAQRADGEAAMVASHRSVGRSSANVHCGSALQ